ncbi:hypothetical protein [Cystobacter ferrugineus]|uniref:Uncharacterized protein n=1 Tax=Cystobacter ferrugineus TaxID=83449 RepID=A0A1L9B333_9BACT|nr:hypothetical protein [Cystobacter ferrugineus]OJH36630.1 hypothetical protein BON30_33295 [Cystobacter ferrugineus]
MWELTSVVRTPLLGRMDRAVLNVYGCTDIQAVYDFRVQLDESERYTWSEDIRDEVLARLLEPNQRRAAEERAQVAAEPPKVKRIRIGV